MKKIPLFFLFLALFVSCHKEEGIDPARRVEGQIQLTLDGKPLASNDFYVSHYHQSSNPKALVFTSKLDNNTSIRFYLVNQLDENPLTCSANTFGIIGADSRKREFTAYIYKMQEKKDYWSYRGFWKPIQFEGRNLKAEFWFEAKETPNSTDVIRVEGGVVEMLLPERNL